MCRYTHTHTHIQTYIHKILFYRGGANVFKISTKETFADLSCNIYFQVVEGKELCDTPEGLAIKG